MRRLFALALALVFLAAGAAAEVKRGDRGEEVKTLQEKLIELGFLNDRADGIFGKKTEAAVKALQKYWDVKASGRLDDEELVRLDDLYFLATGVMAGDGLDEEELRELYPASCDWEDADAAGAVFCFRHQEEKWLEELISAPHAPGKLETLLTGRACELWEQAILAMYEEWESNASEADSDAVLDQQILFEDALEKMQPGRDKYLWLLRQGIDLCFDLHGAEAQPLSDSEGGGGEQ